jgi:hypothetical protein
MKWEELMNTLQGDSVFRTGRLLAGRSSPAHVRRQISRWVKSERLLKLRRGVYALAGPYARSERPHPFAVANALRKASYVSLQSALAHYGMIPEHVPVTTSVTTGRPEELQTPLGRFTFRHVGVPLFFGFTDMQIARAQRAVVATPEKVRELRLEFVPAFDMTRFDGVVERARSAKVGRAARTVRLLHNEQRESL